ncbi:MAG: lysylphosphatidylglycerol synthase domain-containing protein [Xenococcus sp. MO_188.B8]|nr:lysylphosphatidylglycerol synthase domain-containing protein [Xenococcus sp. MO_188.B8]
MKQAIVAIKPYFRWFILGGTLFFLLKTFKERFAEIATVRIDSTGWLMLIISLIITLLAHIWSGWVWTWILDIFQQSLGLAKGIRVYLITNIAKYLPGNVWHFYGRINAVSQKGGSLSAATFSVLLEPLLMAASALLIAIFSTAFGLVKTDFSLTIYLGQLFVLIAVLVGIHPRILNPLLARLSRSQKKVTLAQKIELTKSEEAEETLSEGVSFRTAGVEGGLQNKIDNSRQKSTKFRKVPLPAHRSYGGVSLTSYPLVPFLGEMGFVLFRGLGFIFAFMVLQSIALSQIPTIISAFSIAWLLGLIVPGAPGGIGVFEATAIALLDESQFPPATVLVVVALYRVVSILAEAIAALIAWIIEH